MSPTVVVTGVGATTPIGGDVPSSWSALLEGRSGVRALEQEWAAELTTRFAATAAVDPLDGGIEKHEARRLDRGQQLALIASREAWADAGSPEVDPSRLAVVVGSGVGGVVSLLEQYDILKERGASRVSPMTVPMLMPNGAAAYIGMEVGAQAGVHTPVSACASGAEAVAWGLRIIQEGRADTVVVGGFEAAVHPLTLAAFGNMRALSTRNDDPATASRPYDLGRDGFVMGEGAGMLVIETAESAAARGARVYAVLAGAGMTADSHHIAQPDPEGRGATAAMRLALADAGLSASDVAHVNAHATSTPQGDIAEAQAIRAALGSATDAVAVSGTKSVTGHLLGGAGAIESVFTVLAVHHRLAPPTANIVDFDPAIELDVVRDAGRPLAAGDIAAINNSFGFGGHDVAVAFRSA